MSQPKIKTGREDYQDRREYRTDRLEARADKAQATANAAHGAASTMGGIMNGQPVLVGHHSEKRHRRDLDKMHRNMRTAIDEGRKAERLRDRAAHPSTAISGDDPEAVAKLVGKLGALEAERERFKAENKAARKGDAATLASLAKRYRVIHWHDTTKGHPSYMLTNLGGTIRATKKRIETLRAAVGRDAREETIGDWTLRENPETNRVELDGPRASKDQRGDLKGAGWRWSRQNDVWQRQATGAAWSSAQYLAGRWAG